MKILITGSNGLVGQKISEVLVNTPHEVLCTSKSFNETIDNKHKFTLLDITSYNDIIAVFNQFEPDWIINCAGITQVDQCEQDNNLAWRVNVEGTENLARACQSSGCKLLHLSTDFVFDGLRGMYTEEDEPNPVSYYGFTKLEGEKRIQEILQHFLIVRTVLVYGITKSAMRSNLVTWVKSSLEKGQAIRVVNDQFRTPTLSEDLAHACITLIEQNQNGTFHISGSDYLSVFDMAIKTAEFFKLDTSLISPISSLELNQPGKRPPKTGFVLDKAYQAIAYTPTTIEGGLLLVQNQMEKLKVKR